MNRSIWKNALFGFATVAVGVATSATAALAQVEQRSQISIQGTALVTKDSNHQIPSHEATKSGGFLVGYSYQFSRWFGAEGNYGYARNTQNFITLGGPSSLQADFHEVTGALVGHIPVNLRNVRPYVLGGGGALVSDPTEKFVLAGADRQTRGAFVYGALISISPGILVFAPNIVGLYIRFPTLASTGSTLTNSRTWLKPRSDSLSDSKLWKASALAAPVRSAGSL